MSQLNEMKNDNLPDAVYYDVLTTNFSSTTKNPKPFAFNESRSSPYVENPEHYDLSILRFTIDTGLLPLFIPSIQPSPNNDVNATIYSITMRQVNPIGEVVLAESDQIFLEWLPQDKSSSVPNTPFVNQTGIQDNRSGYYNCYSYNWFLYIVYQAMETALVNLQGQLPGYVAYTDTIYTPVLIWDATRGCAILKAQLGVFNELTGSTPRIEIYFNAPLFNLFNSFPSTYVGYETIDSSNGKNHRLIIADVGGSNVSQLFPDGVPDTGTSATYYNVVDVVQEYSTTSSWNPINAIVFTSNTLPIEPSQVSTPVIFIDGAPRIGGTNANLENIITDLVSDDGNFRPNLVYLPTAQYRLIHLYGNRPLHNLDLVISYRLKTGELIPFKLNSGGSVSVKIGFIKKDKYLK